MAAASECDKCGELFKPAVGCVKIETYDIVSKVADDGAEFDGWTCDLCPKCSVEFLVFVRHEEAVSSPGPEAGGG